MFSRIRSGLGLSVALALLTAFHVFAKGGFSFIAVTGGDLTAEIRITNSDLTGDFFTFADFYRNATAAPTDPGWSYEITRYYVEGSREIAFDHLHYYPETGYVFYDGLINGSSEYDGKWYTAAPGIKSTFENALNNPELEPALSWDIRSAQAMVPPQQTDPTLTSTSASATFLSSTLILILAGLGGFLVAGWLFGRSALGKTLKGERHAQ